jgi:hypothetical protein
MTLAYQGISVEDLPKTGSVEERHQHLFNAYIERMFRHRRTEQRYSKAKARRWLIWLAQRTSQESQTVFLIERLQPNWLPKKSQKWTYAIVLWLTFVLIGGSVGRLVMPNNKLILMLIIGGIIFELLFGVNRITPAEPLKWSWKNAKYNLIFGLTVWPIIGLLLKLIFGLFFGNISRLIFDTYFITEMIQGLISGLSFGFIFGVIRGLSGSGIQTRRVPNQGIWQSAKNAIVFALIAALPSVILFLIGGLKSLFWVILSLSFGLTTGGGEACIKHFMLRVILYCNEYIPWNYARFLNWSVEQLFLQKVGGGYIFIHRLLLEHFAQMQFEQK